MKRLHHNSAGHAGKTHSPSEKSGNDNSKGDGSDESSPGSSDSGNGAAPGKPHPGKGDPSSGDSGGSSSTRSSTGNAGNGDASGSGGDTQGGGPAKTGSGNSKGGEGGGQQTPPRAAKPTDDDFAGGDGVRTTFVAQALIPRADGTILVAGQQGDPAAGAAQEVIQRRNSDGSLDAAFGNSGAVTSSPGAGQPALTAAPAADGGFFTAGTSNGDFVVSRFDASGNPDPSFGQAGQSVADFGSSTDAAYALATLPDGKVVAAGGSGGNFAFARFDANGNLDRGFGQGGRELFSAATGAGIIGSIVLTSDGGIVAAGQSGGNVVLIRLDANGNPVDTFGTGGLLVVSGLAARQDPSLADSSEGLAIAPDGKILVANHTAENHLAVARLNADGSFDASFGTQGIATANFGGNDDADAVFVKADGTIVAVGTTDAGGQPATAVAAFDSSGSLLSGFGNGGMLTLPAGIDACVPGAPRRRSCPARLRHASAQR